MVSKKEDNKQILNDEILAEIIFNRTSVTTRGQAHQAVRQTFKAIQEALASEIPIKIRGFGKFYIDRRRAYETFNVIVQRRITIPACKWVRFVPTTHFKHILNHRVATPKYLLDKGGVSE